MRCRLIFQDCVLYVRTDQKERSEEASFSGSSCAWEREAIFGNRLPRHWTNERVIELQEYFADLCCTQGGWTGTGNRYQHVLQQYVQLFIIPCRNSLEQFGLYRRITILSTKPHNDENAITHNAANFSSLWSQLRLIEDQKQFTCFFFYPQWMKIVCSNI